MSFEVMTRSLSAPPRWVEGYLTIPFTDRGRTERGCDCFGLVRLVMARRAKIMLATYGFVACNDRGAISSAIGAAKLDSETWRAVPIEQAQPLDVVPMLDLNELQNGAHDLVDGHVGIMVTDRHVLHTELASGPVCLDRSHNSIVHRLHPQGAPLVYRHRDQCK